jgi:hypothetical protein
MLAQGMSAAEIAKKIGCTLGTLRVKCSVSGISLRRLTPPTGARKDNIPKRLVLSLSYKIAFHFQQQADKRGMTIANFAATLLEVIARDNLYDAVIGSDIKPNHNTPSLPAGRRHKRTSRPK